MTITTRRIDLVIATTNEGKVREIRQALRGLPLRLRLLSEFSGLQTVDEVGTTYEENATLKALGYSSQTGVYALADDSGLEVAALGGLPGSHSARYGGPGLSDHKRTERLLAALAAFEMPQRSARFISVMVLGRPALKNTKNAEVLKITSGVCEGRIARYVRGSNGFGYDPVFIPKGYQETFGQLSTPIKNRISHRAEALKKMRNFIEAWIGELDHVSDAS